MSLDITPIRSISRTFGPAHRRHPHAGLTLRSRRRSAQTGFCGWQGKTAQPVSLNLWTGKGNQRCFLGCRRPRATTRLDYLERCDGP